MPTSAKRPCQRRRKRRTGLALVLALLLNGCDSHKVPVYQDKHGFRFTPPPGWVERARDDAMPARVTKARKNVPLPPLDVSGKSAKERLLVRYDRLTPGQMAWLRVTITDVPTSTSLQAYLSAKAPALNWKREAEAENLEVSGLRATRIAFVGRWDDQDYLNETVAVRKGENVYIISASFPSSDRSAREQVRQAIEGAVWQ